VFSLCFSLPLFRSLFLLLLSPSNHAPRLPDGLAQLLRAEHDIVGAEVLDLTVGRRGHGGRPGNLIDEKRRKVSCFSLEKEEKVSKSSSFSSPELLARLGERVDVEVRPQEEVDEVGLVGAGL